MQTYSDKKWNTIYKVNKALYCLKTEPIYIHNYMQYQQIVEKRRHKNISQSLYKNMCKVYFSGDN